MGFSLAKLLGTATGAGVSEAAEGVGNAAVALRTALTGELPPKTKEVLIQAVGEMDKAQGTLNEIDAKSGSFFKSGWRPATGWLCVFGLAYAALLSPILEAIIRGLMPVVAGNAPFVMPVVGTETLMKLLYALLGLGTLRTVERVVKPK